jgi:hypothetical protein
MTSSSFSESIAVPLSGGAGFAQQQVSEKATKPISYILGRKPPTKGFSSRTQPSSLFVPVAPSDGQKAAMPKLIKQLKIDGKGSSSGAPSTTASLSVSLSAAIDSSQGAGSVSHLASSVTVLSHDVVEDYEELDPVVRKQKAAASSMKHEFEFVFKAAAKKSVKAVAAGTFKVGAPQDKDALFQKMSEEVDKS